jgi:hypothetical protein
VIKYPKLKRERAMFKVGDLAVYPAQGVGAFLLLFNTVNLTK